MRAPKNSGSLFYNYKGTFSTVLLAISDARYRIIYADVGSYGGQSDGGIFDRSDFKKALESGQLHLPEPARLNKSAFIAPYFFIADAAFPLLPNLIKPWPRSKLSHKQRIYNYRHLIH